MVVDTMRADKRMAGYASVTLEADTGLATMEVTLPDRTATLIGDAGPVGEPEPVSAETFDALARHAGLDPADKLVADQLDAIRGEFEPLAKNGQPGGTSMRPGAGGRFRLDLHLRRRQWHGRHACRPPGAVDVRWHCGVLACGRRVPPAT